MTPERRQYYDGLILFARLTEKDFEEWYWRNYKVSSSVYPDGMFESDEEMKDYENRNTD